MSSINELMGVEPAPIDSLIGASSVSISSVPEATMRNRAVIAAFQTDDSDGAIKNYQTVMNENAVGSDAKLQELTSNIEAVNEEVDFQGMMDLFADPNTPIEQKESAIKNFRVSPRLKSLSMSLADNALASESAGMNNEQDFVRVLTVDSLGEYFDNQREQQGLINAFVISNTEKDGPARSLDWAGVLTPGASALSAVKFETAFAEATGEQRTLWDNLKAAVLPGFSALDFRKKFEDMGDYDKTQFIQKFLGVVQQNSGLIAGDENQVNALQLLDKYLQGDYTTTDAVVDSLFNVLDLVGIGFAAKGVTRGIRGAKQAGVDIPTTPTNAPAAGTFEGAAFPPPKVKAPEIAALEREHSELLSKVQTRLDPGSVKSLNEELSFVDQKLRSMASTAKADIKVRTRELQESGLSFKESQSIAQKEAADARLELTGKRTAIKARLDTNAKSEMSQSQLAAIESKLASLNKKGELVPAKLNPIMDAINRIEVNSVVALDNPASAGNILSYMNPEKGRGLLKAIFDSNTDEVALAAFGTTRQDAIVKSIFPQVGTESGKVRVRVPDAQREIEIPTDEGGLRFTKKEQENMSAAVQHDFRNARGMEVHDAESSFMVTPDGGRFKISAMYGTSEGGFLRATDAMEQAKFALRRYGIRDEDLVVMRKNGLDYEPVELKDVQGVDGDYKIRVDTQVEQSLELMGDGWEAFDVKRNFFDRFKYTMHENEGSLTRMLTDAASNVHPTISGSFTVASDVAVSLEKLLLKQVDAFAQGYNKLGKARKEKVWDYLLEANEKGIKHNVTDLTAKGFTRAEINSLEHFKNFWDNHWQLENLDVIRTMRHQNFQILETKVGDKYFARPTPKNINNAKVLDPTTNTIRVLSKQELDDLYDQGGTIGELKSSVDINGTIAERIMVRNSADEYLRTLNDYDKALNYRDGYFQINYKAPKFIREVQADGRTKAVAIAGDTNRARNEANRLSAANGKEYIVTGDRGLDIDYWDVSSAGGRIAQRRRGQALEGSNGVNHIDGATFIENPVDSAIRAARSIAGRTVTRPAIETAKERALKQYGHLLTKDQYGRPKYPDNVKEIKLEGEYTTKQLADARTTFENIRRFENGYINSIDETTKAIFNVISNGIGELSVAAGGKLSKAERLTSMAAEGKGITGLARGVAFQSYIALSPFRNWIMQPAQVARTLAYNPIDWANGNMVKSLVGISKHITTGSSSPEITKMYNALLDTGMLDAVDRSNLVRGAMMDAADNSNAITKGIGKAFEVSRKIGFDIGEKVNLLGHYTAVWNKYKRKGANLDDPRVLAEIHSETRAISGEMNKAGDMAYNQNSLSMIFQFAQVPHKFVLGMTNRRIDPMTRARMAAGDVILWGVPGTYALSNIFGSDLLPEDPDLRDIVVSGIAAFSLNESMRLATQDDTNVDFSSLAPYNLGGFADIAKAAWEDGGISTLITNSPAGQLLLKDTGRLGSAMNSLMRHFTPIEEGLETPETILDTANQFAKISSGWNNITKAYIAYGLGMALDKTNVPTDTSVTTMEAISMAFGFPTKTTAQHYATIGKLMDNKKVNDTIAKDLANSIFQQYANAYSDESALSPEYTTRITGALLSLAKNNPALAEAVYGQMKMRWADPTDSTIKNIMKAVKMPDIDMVESITKDAPISDVEKSNIIQLIRDVKMITETRKEE